MSAEGQTGGLSRRTFLISLAALAGCQPVEQTAQSNDPTAPDASPIRFVDRAEDAGISYRLGHNGRSPLNILDTAGCGCAFLDYNQDGLLDILLVGQPHCALYRNEGDGAFTDVTAQVGLNAAGTFMGCAVGDYDNDGYPDIFISGYGRNILFHNNGGVTFSDVTAHAGLMSHGPYDWATSSVFADFNNDGRLDLAVGHYVTFTPETLQTCAYSGVQASCPPFYYHPQNLRVYENTGYGRFQDVTSPWGFNQGGHGNNLGLAASDYDGDGRMDLYVANDGLPGDLWHNVGQGFRNEGAISGTAYSLNGSPQAGMGVDWGDYDNDGLLDLIVSSFQDQPKALYHNEGEGQFRFVSYAAGLGLQTINRLAFGVAWADFDNDGRLDLVFANGHVQDTINRIHPPATYAQKAQCFHNRGDGTFEDVSSGCGQAFQTPIVGRGLAIGDYDNDGKPDILMVNLEGKALLLHNESPTRRWLGVRLIGSHSNRDGIGAQISLTAGGLRQIREVQSGRSYLSACDIRALFGLGGATQIDSLTVRWPSGSTQTVQTVGIDHYITVREGEKA